MALPPTLSAPVTDDKRVSRFFREVADRLNALVRLGILVKSDLKTWGLVTGAVTDVQVGTRLARVVAGSVITLTDAASGVAAASYTNANITVDAGGKITAASSGGGGGGGATIGTFASLPAPGHAGATYYCSDSPYQFVDDGAAWNAFVGGNPVVQPPTLTKINATPTTTLTTTYGGYQFSANGVGDQVVSYVKAVTPSSTLRVALGAAWTDQGGFVLHNSNNNKLYIFRYIEASGISLYASRYTADGGTLSAASTFTKVTNWTPWPFTTVILRFDATNWYLDIAQDTLGQGQTRNIFSEALATFIGTNFTGIGFGVNLGGSPLWGVHWKQLHA